MRDKPTNKIDTDGYNGVTVKKIPYGVSGKEPKDKKPKPKHLYFSNGTYKKVPILFRDDNDNYYN